MCKCNPMIRTPWCGKPGCEMPEQIKKDVETLAPQTICSVEDELHRLIGRMKGIQKNAPRCDGARAFALAVTNLEQSLMWVKVIGGEGYGALPYHEPMKSDT